MIFFFACFAPLRDIFFFAELVWFFYDCKIVKTGSHFLFSIFYFSPPFQSTDVQFGRLYSLKTHLSLFRCRKNNTAAMTELNISFNSGAPPVT